MSFSWHGARGFRRAFLVLTSLAASNDIAIGQDATQKEPPWVVVLEEILAADSTESTPATLAVLTGRLSQTMDNAADASTLRAVSAALETATSWNDITSAQRAEWMPHVKASRESHTLECLAPVILALQRTAPTDWAVNYAAYELFASGKHVVNPVRAREALINFRDSWPIDQADDRGTQAVKFADFLGIGADVANDLLSGIALKNQIESCIGLLDSGQRPTPLTAAEIEGLTYIDSLYHTLRKGDQRASLDTLAELGKLQPWNPLAPLIAAELCASFGPAWSKESARRELRRFLELTALQSDRAEEPPRWSPVELRLHYGTLTGRDSASLHILRQHASDVMKEMSKDPAEKLLLFPDYASLARTADSLERDLAEERVKVDNQRDSVQAGEKHVDEVQAQLNAAKRERFRPGERFNTDVSELSDRLQTAKRNVVTRERTLKRMEEAIDKIEGRLDTYRERLRQFEATRK